jgi:hypothetical protein
MFAKMRKNCRLFANIFLFVKILIFTQICVRQEQRAWQLENISVLFCKKLIYFCVNKMYWQFSQIFLQKLKFRAKKFANMKRHFSIKSSSGSNKTHLG